MRRFFQRFGDLLEQVVRLFFVDVELAVAGDAKSRPPGHLVPLEELVEVVGDDAGKGHEVHGVAIGVWEPENPRQNPGDGDDADGGGAVRLQQHPVAESLVEDPGEGMRRIDRYRGEDRFQLFLPVALDEGALLTGKVMDFPQVDPLIGQCRKQLVVPAGVVRADQLVCLGGDRLELLVGGEAVGSTGSGPAVAQLQEAGDPYFEELVEDIGDDPQKAHALQQGVAPVARFFEDTAVEIEPGELAVDVVFGASQVGRHADLPSGAEVARITYAET